MIRSLLVVLLVAACGLQVTLALRHPLWVDEPFSLAMATGHSLEHPAAAAQPERGDFVEGEQPVSAADLRRYMEFDSRSPGIAAVLRAEFMSDTHPPVYYLLLHGWLRLFGTGDLALRSLSILVGLSCIPLVFVLGRKLGGVQTGLVSATLFAFAPIGLYYASEGRMYALLWLVVLWLALATIRLHEGGGRWWQVGWVLGSAVGLLTHYYFVFPWAAALVFLTFRRGADRWSHLAIRVALVLLIIAPWYVQLPANFANWRVTKTWVNARIDYSRRTVPFHVLTQFFTGKGYNLWASHARAETGALVIFLLLLAGGIARDRRAAFAGIRLLPWLWYVAACIGPYVADLARHTYVARNGRYSSAALPAACLLGGWAFTRLRGRLSLVPLALVLACWVPAIVAMFQNHSRVFEPVQDVGRYLDASTDANDLVILHSIPSGVLNIVRYTRTPAAFAPWIEQLGQRRVPDSMNALLHGRRRVVLIKYHTGAAAPEEQWLLAHARAAPMVGFNSITVQEFWPGAGDRF